MSTTPRDTAPIRLRLLGAPICEHGGAALPFATDRPYQLLAFLAQQADWVSRERLAALFWPDHGADAARRNVRKVLFRTKSLLEAHRLPPLDDQSGSVRWVTATDVRDFEQAAAAGDVDAALAHWRGDPWQGLDGDGSAFADWVRFERQRLLSMWRDMLLGALDRADRADEPAGALRFARLLLAVDPLDEPALQAQIRIERAAGRQVEATQALRRFADTLSQAHGLQPALRTRALLDGSTLGPNGEDAFLGRVAEAQELGALFAQGSRWVTLVGHGGAGKSRLARHAMPRLAATFVDGGHWLSLEEVGDDGAAMQALLSSLGITPKASEPAAEALQRALAARSMLLVLDNLEHLPRSACDIAQALLPCTGVRVLATSRIRLGVPGEWLMPLAGLPFPGPEDVDRADAFDAVRLFVHRAHAQDPAFRLDAQRAAIVALAGQVEGLPLALELAALSARHLPVAEIVADLQRGDTRVLDAGEQIADPRRRSLHAVFNQSWRLLVPSEQRLLAALSVFHGGFTRDAARAVCAAAQPVLLALLDKSLVRVDDGGRSAGGTRLSLHPLVQQFAAEQLAAIDCATTLLRQAHAAHFMQVLARYPRGRIAEQAAFFDAVEADLANVRVAWRHAAAHGARAEIAAGCLGLASYYHSRARCDEGLDLLETATPLLQADPHALAWMQIGRALLEYSRSHYPETAELARAALAFARVRKDQRLRRPALFMLGQASLSMGHYDAARRCYTESLKIARQENNGHAIAGGLALLGALATIDGRYAESIELHRQSIEQQARIGFEQSETNTGLAFALHRAGRQSEARVAFDRAHAMLPPHAGGTERTNLAYYEALAAFEAGELERAEQRAAHARDGIADGGEPSYEAAVPLLLARIALHRGQGADALAMLQHGLRVARRLRMQWLVLDGLVRGAEYLLARGEPDQAADALQVALAARGLPCKERADADALLAQSAARSEANVPARAFDPSVDTAVDAAVDAILALR